MVGVPGDQFAVNSADSGAGWDGTGQAKRPKNAPRKARGTRVPVAAVSGWLGRRRQEINSSVAPAIRGQGDSDLLQ